MLLFFPLQTSLHKTYIGSFLILVIFELETFFLDKLFAQQ